MTPPLPDAESDVLAALYEMKSGTARDVRQALESRRPMAHASVATLLGRLEQRGLVKRRKADTGKAFIYQPTTARPRAFAASLKRAVDIVERGFGGSSVALIASLFETRRPSADELRELQRLVRTYKDKDAG
jgi:BlaI family penicillinase repressor